MELLGVVIYYLTQGVKRFTVLSFIKLEIGNSDSSQTCKIENDVSNTNAQGKHH